jgi:hypothetical protein
VNVSAEDDHAVGIWVRQGVYVWRGRVAIAGWAEECKGARSGEKRGVSGDFADVVWISNGAKHVVVKGVQGGPGDEFYLALAV